MPDFDRICSAQDAIGDISGSEYTIFEEAIQDKQVVLWQPSGSVTDINEMPSPVGMEAKAEAFLERAVNCGCHLAAAPEFAYDTHWVLDHEEYLFHPESPLFVLGCAPVRIEEMGQIIDQLRTRYECFSAEVAVEESNNPVPQNDAKEFVTPTVVPIKEDARSGEDGDALLIQFKNKHMSGGVNSAEERNLSEGRGVWRINPAGAEPELAIWTCSDVGDPELNDEMVAFGHSKRSFIVHVQCNPEPFHSTWTRFREELFETRTPVTYVSVNWGTLNSSVHCGYSGVYTKTLNSTVLGTEYDQTCQLGGLIGTRPECKSEYVCMLPDDAVSKFSFARLDPNSPPALNRRMANLKIVRTWEYDGDTYDEISSFSYNEPDDCGEWRNLIDTNPHCEELIGAIFRAEIAVESLPDEFNPSEDILWATLESLHGGETEELGPLLCLHDRRKSTTDHRQSIRDHPESIAGELLEVSRLATDMEQIELDSSFDKEKVPVNATYQTEDVPICLSFLRQGSEPDEINRAKWLQSWLEKDDIGFKPVVVVNRMSGAGQMKTLAQLEDTTKVMSDPENVDTNAGLIEL